MLHKARFGKARSSERGQSAIETAVSVFIVFLFLVGALEFGLVSVARFTSALAAFAGTRSAIVQPDHASESAGDTVRKTAGVLIDPALLVKGVQDKAFPVELKRDGKYMEVSSVYYRPQAAWRSFWQGFSFAQIRHRFRLPVEDEEMYVGSGVIP